MLRTGEVIRENHFIALAAVDYVSDAKPSCLDSPLFENALCNRNHHSGGEEGISVGDAWL